MKQVLLLALLALGGSVPLQAAAPVDYLREVKPLLAARCGSCHGALQQKGDLRVDTANFLRTGGKNGPALLSGRSSESLLLAHVTAIPGKRRMPPPSEGEPLTEREVALLRDWIDQGASAPADELPEPDPVAHWAFRPVARPAVPTVAGEQPRNPIDAFLAAARAPRGLPAQPPADRRTLLRRVYLDLVGLPPTPAEIQAFVDDPAPDAYEKVVDRLLASPQHGERWARHWMDIWRYSDWWGLGADVRNSQKHIWHWRDWIVESLHADKGYDQMLREMLAADELYPTDLDRLRATGFLVRHYFKFNRNTWLDETVEHTGKAFLGLTLNCARCHDHKYDPIAQTDYYRFRAFFEPYQVRTDQLPGQADLEKDGLPRVFDCNLEAPTYRFLRGDEKQPVTTRRLTPGLPPLLAFAELDIRPVALPREAHAPGLRPFVLADHLRLAEQRVTEARQALEQATRALREAERAAATPAPRAAATPAPPSGGTVLLRDEFATARPEAWDVAAGAWKYESGRLQQHDGSETRAVLQARQRPPADFQARLRFAITGGEPWRSVGLCFDVAGDDEVLVYASAHAGGPKLQVSYRHAGGAYVFPAEGMQARPIRLHEPLELTVSVRGSLVNVAVDGQHALAYQLPFTRQPGDLRLITYAATAEFQAFELSTLPEQAPMVAAAGPAAPDQARERGRAALAAAAKALAAAEAQLPALRARAAADRARFQEPPAPEAATLAQQAALAEAQANLARAEETLARAEVDVLAADSAKRPAAVKKRDAARDGVAAARKTLAAPGTSYTPLRGALKAPESNVETEDSRNRPFPTTSTGRRSALARWLTDPRHPLTARVAVNHVWARHLGTPLVATVFDFGRKGAAPTHPELLDWLAAELRDNGWSLKHLHRLIVTSAAYQRTSSAAGADLAHTADPENRTYWRMNPRRMEAQVLRDSLLHLAGTLDLTRGGPPLNPVTQDSVPRRSLYFTHSHNDHHRFLSLFDDANVLECYRRQESIVPQQALALSNSRFALDAATRISDRLHERLGGGSDPAFVRAAFETVLAGVPTAEEEAECLQALARLTAVAPKQADAGRRARVGLVRALLNHNDFVTIR